MRFLSADCPYSSQHLIHCLKHSVVYTRCSQSVYRFWYYLVPGTDYRALGSERYHLRGIYFFGAEGVMECGVSRSPGLPLWSNHDNGRCI